MSLMKHRSTSTVVLTSIGVVVALLVVVAIVFALQPPTQFDPGTPEGTAQGYFQALNDGDTRLAESFMTEDLRRACQDDWWYFDPDSTNRVLITGSLIDGTTATIEVDIESSYGDGPFDGGSYRHDERLSMERHGEIWFISEPAWPMDRRACEKLDR